MALKVFVYIRQNFHNLHNTITRFKDGGDRREDRCLSYFAKQYREISQERKARKRLSFGYAASTREIARFELTTSAICRVAPEGNWNWSRYRVERRGKKNEKCSAKLISGYVRHKRYFESRSKREYKLCFRGGVNNLCANTAKNPTASHRITLRLNEIPDIVIPVQVARENTGR